MAGEVIDERGLWQGSALDECQPRRLPMQPGPLFGRDWELDAIRLTLLRADVRLLTVWGPAGIGKTRLALAVAAELEMAAEFDSVVFVDLAPVVEASGVIPAIIEALGVEARPARRGVPEIICYLQSRSVLLVLDNVEHVVDVAPELAPLLASCPALKILCTSRAALRLRWEHAFPLAPLAVPRAPYPSDPESVASYAGVMLFVARASAVKRDFQLTDANAGLVAELCARLDGLPLALELAASRIKGLPLLVLLDRLEQDRLQLLQAGAPDLPVRQRTLRRALAWSYDLLDPEQQALFRRLSVFVDGCTPEAAEAVCGESASHGDVLEALAALVDASLVSLEEPAAGPPRYTMLATVRDYALRLLSEGGEAHEIRRRHAAYYLDSASQSGWLDREHGNLRAALQWTADSELDLERFEGARLRLEEALAIAAEQQDQPGMASVIDGFARLAASEGAADRALCLHAAAERLRGSGDTSTRRWSAWSGQLEADLARARAALGHSAADAALARGRSLALEQVLRLCLGDEVAAAAAATIECPQVVVVNGYLEEFTRREREVIDLAVRGWSNRQIAQRLVISERTAEGHIHNILAKLQLDSRAQLAAWGVRAGVVPSDEPSPSPQRAPALRG